MRDEEVRQILHRIETPAPRPEAKQQAWEAARLAYVQREREPSAAPRWRFAPIGMFAAGITLGMVLLLVIQNRRSLENGGSWAKVLQREEAVLAQANTLFPDHLKAIVTANGEQEIQTIDDGIQPATQPLVAEFERSGKKVRVTTFSGQKIKIDTEEFEFLISGDGRVLIIGPDFVWSSADAKKPKNKIRAQVLPAQGMSI